MENSTTIPRKSIAKTIFDALEWLKHVKIVELRPTREGMFNVTLTVPHNGERLGDLAKAIENSFCPDTRLTSISIYPQRFKYYVGIILTIRPAPELDDDKRIELPF